MSTNSRILILAQTNPNLSKTYTETVCTAGLEEVPQQNPGECKYRWIRLYPIVKRVFGREYHKYQWVTCSIEARGTSNDRRPESRKVYMDTIVPGERIGTERGWEIRRNILLYSGLEIYEDKEEIMDAARNNTFSLCLFKPSRIIGFKAYKQDTNFTPDEQNIIDRAKKEQYLIEPLENGRNFSKIGFKKLPYHFKCEFLDKNNKKSNLAVLDWEMSTLLRNELRSKTEEDAKDSTLKKYNGFMEKNDLYFILGTRNKDHNMLISNPEKTINPWSIISVIYFPQIEGEPQRMLFT